MRYVLVPSESGSLLDDLVGHEQQPAQLRGRDIELLGGLEIDDEFAMPDLDIRQVLRLDAIEDHGRPNAEPTVDVCELGPLAHKTASFDIFAPRVARRYLVLCSETNDLGPVAVKEWISTD